MSNVTPLPPEPFLLNTAQESGIAGVEEHMDKAYALISGAQAWLKGWPEDTTLTKEDLSMVHTLLDMAEDELGDRRCLNRIREGRFR